MAGPEPSVAAGAEAPKLSSSAPFGGAGGGWGVFRVACQRGGSCLELM